MFLISTGTWGRRPGRRRGLQCRRGRLVAPSRHLAAAPRLCGRHRPRGSSGQSLRPVARGHHRAGGLAVRGVGPARRGDGGPPRPARADGLPVRRHPWGRGSDAPRVSTRDHPAVRGEPRRAGRARSRTGVLRAPLPLEELRGLSAPHDPLPPGLAPDAPGDRGAARPRPPGHDLRRLAQPRVGAQGRPRTRGSRGHARSVAEHAAPPHFLARVRGARSAAGG
jgi:hypothetical protein